MSRKPFNRIASGVLVVIVVCALAVGMLPATKMAALPLALPDSSTLSLGNDGIRSLDFDAGWKFVLVNPNGIGDPTGQYGNSLNPLAAATSFDDSSWRSVNVPHDWSIELLPTNASGTGTSGGTGYLQGGLGWYRKTFTLPPSMAGKKISIDFDGVYMDSYEYLNGTLLGNHPYGYTGFAFDVTNLVHTDGVTPNVLAVVVQNQLPSSRWYSGSGIYRNVHLVVTDPIHVTRFGTLVTTPNLETTIQSGYADVQVQTNVINESGSTATIDIVSKIKDATGAVVGQTTSTGAALGSTVYTDAVHIQVNNPTLWSFDNRYLYTLETDLVNNGSLVDTYNTTFGIRYYKIDPNTGFSLNGQHAKLQGVDLHHDMGALGSAINYDALYREMSILKSMGVNSFRTSHNPPSPEMLDVNQRLGIVMMVEAFDSWSSGKTTNDYGRFFNQWSDYDITEMVNEAKNNPAVIMWSIGNEIPGFTSVSNLPTAQRLIDDIHSIDTTRYVVAGSDQYRSLPSSGSGAEQILLKLDGMGLNYNPALVVDRLHAKYPTKFFFESESSSETSSRGVYQDPDAVNTGENYAPGRRGASSYDNNLASWTMSNEYGLKKDRDRLSFAGQYIWSGFDYIGEPTPYGQFPVKVSSFGAIDTAGFPKDSYYLFQSQWTNTPMVHLVPMNWTDYKPGENVEVWANSNVDTVELFLNGASLGVKTFNHKTSKDGVNYLETTETTNDDKNYTAALGYPNVGSYNSPSDASGGPTGADRTGSLHLTWNVPFAPGKLVAVATQNGLEVARDELDTAGPAYTLRLTPDKTVLKADGKSLSYITVEVVDSNGVMLPSASNLINFSVTGSGTFEGADNGRQESAEGYQDLSHSAYNGKLVAIVGSTTTPGPITFTVSSAGLVPVTLTLFASNTTGSGLVALAPAYVRVPLGTTPTLPSTVKGLHADGTSENLAVTWDSLPATITTQAGTYTVNGTTAGTGLPAQAIIAVYKLMGVQGYSTAVPVGTAPFLPPTVRVVYSDGSDAFLPVTWDAVNPSQYATAGQFTVNGAVAGIAIPAVASIRVTSTFAANQNLARAAATTGGSTSVSVGSSTLSGGNTTLAAGSTTISGGSTALAAASAVGDTNIKVNSVSNFAAGQTISIDIVPNVETATIASVGTSGATGTGLTLAAPLALAHATNMAVFTITPAGSTNLKVGSVTNFAAGQTVGIESGAYFETATIAAVGTSGATGTGIILTAPTSFAHQTGVAVAAITPAGATNIKVANITDFAAGQTINIDTGVNLESAVIANVGTSGVAGTGITLAAPLTLAHTGAVAARITSSVVGATNIKVASVSNFNVGDTINIDTVGSMEARTITAVGTAGLAGTGLTLNAPLALPHYANVSVAAYFPAGVTSLRVSSVTGFNVGDTVNIDTSTSLETRTIASVGTSGATGTGLTFNAPLALPHYSGASVGFVAPLRPAADASYAGSNSALPAAMLDGTTTSGGWSNAFTKGSTNVLLGINTGTPQWNRGRASDWVSVSWPKAQTFSTMNAYFTTSSSRVLPSPLTVSYWNGLSFVPVSNLNITWAGASNQPSTITFDPVATTQIRLDLTSPLPNSNTGFMQIAELQVTGNLVTYNTTASLTDLKVNGQTITGFNENTTSYTLPSVKKWPEITASAANNGSLLIIPPLAIPGTGTVTVTSEDGSGQKTYSIYIGNVAPQVTSSLASQDVQYTDRIQTVTIAATDAAADLPLSAATQWSLNGAAFQSGLPSWLTLTPAPCTVDGIWGTCTWTLTSTSPVPVQAGTYVVRTTVSDGVDSNDTDVTIVVTPEDAAIQYTGDAIAQIGTNLSLRVTVWDSAASGYLGANPEIGSGATIGDLTKMWIAFDLYPAGTCLSGTPTTKYAQVADTGTSGDGVGTASSTFTSAAEASYCVVARLVADSSGGANQWYTADDAEAAALTFYENTGQFATGGGWVNDPAGGKGNFGFNARYNKKGQPQGQLVYVYRGLYNGVPADFVIRSNALNALAFGGKTFPIPATLQGKATIQINRSSDGALLYTEGNATFQATVIDSGATSGVGSDSFALVVYNKNGVVYKSVPTTLLRGGNVVIHQ